MKKIAENFLKQRNYLFVVIATGAPVRCAPYGHHLVTKAIRGHVIGEKAAFMAALEDKAVLLFLKQTG